MDIGKKGIDFICAWETGGRRYYEKVYKSTFIWPGLSSGPTIAIGVDCGFYKKEELTAMFEKYVSSDELKLIHGAIRQTGQKGRAYTKKLKGIVVTWDESLEIFSDFTLPKFEALAENTFPGVGELCASAQIAMLSLVFNRGSSLVGSRRAEMAKIKKLVPKKDYKSIAAEFRSMKRLWAENKNSDSDLTDRREAEAKLVESCL